jgi:hypothetical protein
MPRPHPNERFLGLGVLELEVGLPVQVVELGAFGLLDRPVRVTKRLGQAVPKRPVLYELRMSLEAARLSFGKSDRRTRVHEAAHVAGRLDQGVGRGSTQKCGLNVTAPIHAAVFSPFSNFPTAAQESGFRFGISGRRVEIGQG